MTGCDQIRSLPAWLLIVALPIICQAQNRAQNPTPELPGAGTPAASTVLPASTPDHPAIPAPPVQPQVVRPAPEEQADSFQAAQRYQAALQAYSKVEHPTAEIWNKMGIANQMMLNMKEAERCYKQSIKLNPKNASVINNLATVYDSQKLYKQAEKMYRKALKIAPKSAIIYKNLGTNLLVQHKNAKGLEAYHQAMAIDPNVFTDSSSPRVSNPASLQERGAMNYFMALGCVRAGQTDCALQFLRQALNEGYITVKKLASDEGFLSLRDNPGFQQLLADQQPHPPLKQ